MPAFSKAQLDAIEMKRAEYATQFDEEFQQKKAKFRQFCDVMNIGANTGSRYEMPRAGSTESTYYMDNFEDIVDKRLLFDKRSIFYNKFYNSIWISRDEVADMKNLDYTFGLAKKMQLAAAERTMDEIFLGVIKDAVTHKYRLVTESDTNVTRGGILNTNWKGENGQTAVSLNLNYEEGSNLIPIDYASSGVGISDNLAGTFIDKIELIRAMFEANDVFDGSEVGTIVCWISPFVAQMLRMYESKVNKDYGFNKLGEGLCVYNEYTRVQFVVSNMLPLMDTVDKYGNVVKDCRECVCFLKNRVGFGLWKDTEFELLDVNTKVAVRHRQIASGKAGCARKDEDTVLILPVKEPSIYQQVEPEPEPEPVNLQENGGSQGGGSQGGGAESGGGAAS